VTAAERAVAELGRADRVILRLAATLVRLACRRLPEPERTKRQKEWTGELYGPLTDPDLRWWIRRAWATVLYAADQQRTIHALPGTRSRRVLRPSRATPGLLLPVTAFVAGGVIFWVAGVINARALGGGVFGGVAVVFAICDVFVRLRDRRSNRGGRGKDAA
jgi:hypothetical protein